MSRKIGPVPNLSFGDCFLNISGAVIMFLQRDEKVGNRPFNLVYDTSRRAASNLVKVPKDYYCLLKLFIAKIGVFAFVFNVSVSLAWAATGVSERSGHMPQLSDVFDAAWQRQPEAQSFELRQEAAEAERDAARSWIAEPPSLDLSLKTDQLNRNEGVREYELGVSIPLWLPGERSRSGALADAQSRSVSMNVAAARLRTAAQSREVYWAWARAHIEHTLSSDRLANARALAADVRRRVKAGELARADQYQADGVVAAAESAFAGSDSALMVALQQLKALTGQVEQDFFGQAEAKPEPVPDLPESFGDLDISHPSVEALTAQAEVAIRTADLARVQTRANPELVLMATRDRGMFNDPYQHTVTFGLRIPFGSGARQRARAATANAEALEIESQLRQERVRILAQLDIAKQRVASSRQQAEAASRRAELGAESRRFFEKSFQAGETDLPTLLRIELEAVESQRQAALSRIDHAEAISTLRQALGLLPE